MLKYMGNYYATKTDRELATLHSKKYNRVTHLRNQASTYLNLQEIKKLNEQMLWIRAEQQCRIDQLELGL